MGAKKIDKQLNYSHGPAQAKQRWLMHSWSTFGAWMNTGKHGFTRLTTTHTWGKPSPSPLQYTLCLATGPAPKCHFVLRFASESPKIPKIGIPVTLETHNFVCRPLIEMMSRKKLQLLSKVFQWYVAHHLYARELGRFLTFNSWESNWQFDFRLVFQVPKWAMRAHSIHLGSKRFPMI